MSSPGDGGTWRPWRSAGWASLCTAVLVLAMLVPVLIGGTALDEANAEPTQGITSAEVVFVLVGLVLWFSIFFGVALWRTRRRAQPG